MKALVIGEVHPKCGTVLTEATIAVRKKDGVRQCRVCLRKACREYAKTHRRPNRPGNADAASGPASVAARTECHRRHQGFRCVRQLLNEH